MKNLQEYLTNRKIKINDFAESIGVSGVVVRNWLKGSHSPRLVHAMIIYRFTRKKVKLESLLNDRDLRLFNESK